ncbi:unnamed protein product [Calypogeia fissa]
MRGTVASHQAGPLTRRITVDRKGPSRGRPNLSESGLGGRRVNTYREAAEAKVAEWEVITIRSRQQLDLKLHLTEHHCGDNERKLSGATASIKAATASTPGQNSGLQFRVLLKRKSLMLLSNYNAVLAMA